MAAVEDDHAAAAAKANTVNSGKFEILETWDDSVDDKHWLDHHAENGMVNNSKGEDSDDSEDDLLPHMKKKKKKKKKKKGKMGSEKYLSARKRRVQAREAKKCCARFKRKGGMKTIVLVAGAAGLIFAIILIIMVIGCYYQIKPMNEAPVPFCRADSSGRRLLNLLRGGDGFDP